jgi:hypothetical protein
VVENLPSKSICFVNHYYLLALNIILPNFHKGYKKSHREKVNTRIFCELSKKVGHLLANSIMMIKSNCKTGRVKASYFFFSIELQF